MNRRQFLKRGAMTAVAVSVAPAAVLAAKRVIPYVCVADVDLSAPLDPDEFWYITWKDESGLNVVRCSVEEDGCAYVPKALEHIPNKRYHYVDGETARQQMRDVGRNYLAHYGTFSV